MQVYFWWLYPTKLKLNSQQKEFKSNINSFEKRLDSKFSQIESKLNQVESKIELVLSEIRRMIVLIEEQNARNKFILDGYASLHERLDRLELRFDQHEKKIENFILKRKE